MTNEEEIKKALITNSKITLQIIQLAYAQKRMITDLLETLREFIEEDEDTEDDSA